LNYTNLTTIPFNGLLSSPSLALGGIAGIEIPEYLLYIFAVIFVIFGAITLNDTKDSVYGLGLILIAIWFIGLTNYIILAFALIISAIFLIYEVTSHRQVQKVHQVRHHG
jgi:hypothetical protein